MARAAIPVKIRCSVSGQYSTEGHKKDKHEACAADTQFIQNDPSQNSHQQKSVRDGVKGNKQTVIGIGKAKLID